MKPALGVVECGSPLPLSIPALRIEDGIPLPPRGQQPDSRSGQMRAALARLQPGQSFVWDGHWSIVYSAARAVGCRVTTRKLETGGIRVWKIA